MNNSFTQQGQQIGAQATQNIDIQQLLKTILGMAQPMGQAMAPVAQMNPAVGGLSKLALDSLNKVGKQYYEAKAQEVFMTNPDAGEAMIKQAEMMQPQKGKEGQANGPQMNPGQLQNSPMQQGMPGFGQQPQPTQQFAMEGGQDMNSLLVPQQDKTRGFFDPGGFNAETNTVRMPGAFMSGWGMDRIAKQQQIMGQQPLQAGEREKEEMSTSRELLKLKATLDAKGYEGLPAEQATKFGLLMEGRDAVIEIDNLVGTGDIGKIAAGQKFTPDFFKSPAQRDLQLALETAVDNRTRLETGAALQPQELKREAKKLMPRVGEDKKTWRKRVGRSFDYFNRSIAVLDPQGIHEARAGNARERYSAMQGNPQGDIRQQAIQELARRRAQKNA